MPRAKDYLDADDVQEPTVSERNPTLKPAATAKDWQEGLDAGRDQGPTSAHEDKGWRALKPF